MTQPAHDVLAARATGTSTGTATGTATGTDTATGTSTGDATGPDAAPGTGVVRILGPGQGVILGPSEATDRFVLDATETAGRIAVVEHTIAPGVLAAPVHRHTREDEYSYVLEGRVGAMFDGVEVTATAGDFVRKPRGEWHTFWNAGDGPLRILEIITPGGLEELFRAMGAPDASPDLLDDVEHTYGCAIDEERTAVILQRHGLRMWASGGTPEVFEGADQ